jgi:hypothetical protein
MSSIGFSATKLIKASITRARSGVAPGLAPGLGAELRLLTADEAARLPPRFRAMAALLK